MTGHYYTLNFQLMFSVLEYMLLLVISSAVCDASNVMSTVVQTNEL